MYIVPLISKFKALDSDELRLYVLTMEFLRLLRTTIHIHEIVFIGSSPRRRCYKCEVTKMDDTHSESNVHLFIGSIMYTLWGLQEGTSYYTTILHSWRCTISLCTTETCPHVFSSSWGLYAFFEGDPRDIESFVSHSACHPTFGTILCFVFGDTPSLILTSFSL